MGTNGGNLLSIMVPAQTIRLRLMRSLRYVGNARQGGIVNGKWLMENGQWTIDNGQLIMDNG